MKTADISSAVTQPRFSCHPARPRLAAFPEHSLLKSASGIRRRMARESPRVLLFVPPYTRMLEPSPPGSAFRDLGIDTFEVMKRAGTPIGLLRIATNASRAGYTVKIVDAPFAGWHQEDVLLQIPEGQLLRYGLTDAQIVKIVTDFEPDVVGIQCNYTVQWGNARALADLLKRIDPELLVVSGGAHSSGDWENAIIDSPIDIIVCNEADQSFVALLDAVTDPDVPIEEVTGVAYRRGFTPIRNDRMHCGRPKSKYISINPSKQSLAERRDLMPLPDFSFISMANYELPYHSAGARARLSGAWAQVFSTIGCNVGCDFCYIPMVNGPWRALGTDWFDLHLSDLKRHGVSEVLIEDDHLMHDPLYALEVCKLLKKHDLPWVEEGGLSLFNLMLLHGGQSFLDSMSPEEQKHPNFVKVIKAMNSGVTARSMIEAMADSGCYNVYLAVESANEDSLTNSNKPRINSIQRYTSEIVEMFSANRIQVTGGFMLGFVNAPETEGGQPYIETLGEVQRTIDYAVTLMRSGMAYANPFIVTPIPGTRTWEFQKDYVVRNYDTGWSHEKATMATQHWSAEDMECMRLKLLVDANGADRVVEMIKRGTWPVDNQQIPGAPAGSELPVEIVERRVPATT
jgi:radical SAM superfamily enzyme YgiQ (UPF0313 family)